MRNQVLRPCKSGLWLGMSARWLQLVVYSGGMLLQVTGCFQHFAHFLILVQPSWLQRQHPVTWLHVSAHAFGLLEFVCRRGLLFCEGSWFCCFSWFGWLVGYKWFAAATGLQFLYFFLGMWFGGHLSSPSEILIYIIRVLLCAIVIIPFRMLFVLLIKLFNFFTLDVV